MVIKFLCWDWKGGLAVDTFAKAINEFAGGPVYATVVDAGTEDYILALTDRAISSAEARREWEMDGELS